MKIAQPAKLGTIAYLDCPKNTYKSIGLRLACYQVRLQTWAPKKMRSAFDKKRQHTFIIGGSSYQESGF